VRIVVSEHAAKRYVERIRPGLRLRAAKTALHDIARFAISQPGPPTWANCHPSPKRIYLVSGDLCLPARMAGGQIVVLTVIARANGRVV
jgi:hypothetical protein